MIALQLINKNKFNKENLEDIHFFNNLVYILYLKRGLGDKN